MKLTVKQFLLVLLSVFLLSCIGIINTLHKKNIELQNSLSISKSNEKALLITEDTLNNKVRELQLTTEQLSYFNDSIIKKLNSVRNELKIKDKDLKSLQYISSKANKVDTVVFRDTIFKEKDFRIDTIISDRWYRLNLELEYPNKIIANPSFNSEKYVVIHTKRETIDPPKKCWLLRLFQKKHTVVEVDIIEESPYIENKQQRFIEIVK